MSNIEPPTTGSNVDPPVTESNVEPPTTGSNVDPPTSGSNVEPPTEPIVPPPTPLESFNANFTVRVADYKELVDTPNTVKVIYEVLCNSNRRVGVFISDVDTLTLSEGFTPSDVLEAAWDEVKTSVKDWADVNIQHEQYTTYTVPSTTEAITLQDFNDNFNVQLIRYELYPKVSPSSWCIGFYIYSSSRPGVNMFVDGNVPIEDFCNNVLCVSVTGAVWNTIKERVCSWAAAELAKPPVINTNFVPSTLVLL